MQIYPIYTSILATVLTPWDRLSRPNEEVAALFGVPDLGIIATAFNIC
jgi:hypothetical protein